ncbi:MULTISPECIES: hypothetical protein [unclassified Mesobacillus]|uniref:hypothetical protein n=1 Tax=unclassified Mesobacillus TaxID=2675270 RepID=UPI00203E1F65|nr:MULTISPECIES: hypothetical protein [unclassified Mesobacillus]MCM3121659.1 hypothetical protein [Mesobacillus sp. MER 33]MCM3231623.1 hypothetical protein [Mesobacillus sp. MER 48]
MEEVMKLTDQFVYSTSTADVTTPDDFIVEFLADLHEQTNLKIIKIKNLDELMDFIETMDIE